MNKKSKETSFRIPAKDLFDPRLTGTAVITFLFAIGLGLISNHINTIDQFSTQEAATQAAIFDNMDAIFTARAATREIRNTEAYMTGVAIGNGLNTLNAPFNQTQTAEALTGTPIPTPSLTPTP